MEVKKLRTRLMVSLLFLSLMACNTQEQSKSKAPKEMVSEWPQGVNYEIFVQAFYDSNGDGIGDFNGLCQKLDYLQELGVEGIWLMPIGPSPSYHKYDVTDYKDVHPDYGTMDDFKNMIREAHKRNIRIVMDFVINHTARDHPWFQESMKGKDNPYRDYYVWANDEEIEKEGSLVKEATGDSDNIVQWHEAPGNDEKYYGFFWGGMPDLNFDNEKVKEEIFEAGRFWLEEVGVDGFRLDAAKHIFPDHRPKDNHAFWVEFREAMEAVKPNVYLVGEVWDQADVVAPYLAGLPSLFNFDLGFTITQTVREEQDTRNLVETLKNIYQKYQKANPDYIDATFITNHDQNRIMSEVAGDENKARMAAALLLTLPGSPYLYYGEEIGMKGMKPDEQIREPFLWDEEGKDPGQTTWVEAEYSTYENVRPLSVQKEDPESLYHFYKDLIHERRSHLALVKGDIGSMEVNSPGIIAFTRSHEGETLLVLHNISGKKVTISPNPISDAYESLLYSTKEAIDLKAEDLEIPAYSSYIFQ